MNGVGPDRVKLFGYESAGNINPVGIYTWDTGSLSWQKQVPISAGGGGAVTIANGADVAEGSTTDAAVITDVAGTVSGKLRGLVKWAFERMPAALGQTTMAASLPVVIASNQSAVPVSAASLPLPTGAATEVSLLTRLTEADFDTKTGSLTEAAPATDTASSGVNGRLQRIAQRLTSLIALLPAALIGGRLDVNIGAAPAAVTLGAGAAVIGSLTANQSVNVAQWVGSATPTVGQKTMAASIPVTLASDQTTLPAVSESRSATLHVTATAAVNVGATCTLPAAGAGLFHYITNIELVKLYSVVGIAAGAGVIITSTNLPGAIAWTTEQLASLAGTAVKVISEPRGRPLKSSVANTATTLVAPAQLQTIWRWNVSYFTAA